MKIRKHKNNKTFRIAFKTRLPGSTSTHVSETGKTRKVTEEGKFSPLQVVFAVGSCKQSVRRAFLIGRDASNILASIREAGIIPILFLRTV